MAERVAEARITSEQHHVLFRNHQCRSGELDLIALDLVANELAIIEVRYRESVDFGSAAGSVDSKKQRRIIAATGDFGPVHVDEGYASTTRFGERLAPGILVAGICTSVLTAELVGTVGVSIRDSFWFTGAVRYGDTITFDIWISSKDEENRTVDWQASARNEEGVEVLKADATLKFPRKRVTQ